MTDRTQADVDALNSKGTYNADDLNRVIENCNEIAATLTANGYPLSLTWTKTNWTRSDIPTTAQMAEFINNVNAIKAALPSAAPNAPPSMAYLTFEGANNIEKLLYEVSVSLTGMMTIYPKSGVYLSGAVLYIPDVFSPFDFSALDFAKISFSADFIFGQI